MNVIETKLEGVVVIQPSVFKDDRGYFYESFSQKEFINKVGIPIEFVQDNESCSGKNTVRGIHWQRGKHAQAKLVRCSKGKLLDVAVDLRMDSPTFMKYVIVELSEENKLQLFIPRGFGHAFIALEDNTVLQYKCDNYYNKESEASIYPFDADVDIKWPIKPEDAVMSYKDKTGELVMYIDREKMFLREELEIGDAKQ